MTHADTIAHLERCAACRRAAARLLGRQNARRKLKRMTRRQRSDMMRAVAQARWSRRPNSPVDE